MARQIGVCWLGSKKLGKGKGILITIDETQAASHDDLVAIATAVQHVITDADESDTPDEDKKGVAIVFAGLPYMVNDLLDNEVTTFLRRALRRELDNVPLPDVKNAFLETVADSGKTISGEDALEAARQSEGYPYMVQLVGYYMWQSAQRRGSNVITADDVSTGVSDALLAFDDSRTNSSARQVMGSWNLRCRIWGSICSRCSTKYRAGFIHLVGCAFIWWVVGMVRRWNGGISMVSVGVQ